MKYIKNILIYVLLVFSFLACIGLTYYNLCCEKVVINGNSMNPTLNEGDLGLYTKKNFILGDIKRFDIIVFDSHNDASYIKRVIALPGEHIRIEKNGNIYINNQLIEQNFIGQNQNNYTYISSQSVNMEMTLKEDEYFVLGDNRKVSYDSRYFGAVKEDDIEGKFILSYGKYHNYNQETNTWEDKSFFPIKFYLEDLWKF